MRVDVPGAGITVHLRRGETIHTESSHKFAAAEMSALLETYGFTTTRTFRDAEERYAVSLFKRI
jgi:L-histidine Nalpha-methyltransferase